MSITSSATNAHGLSATPVCGLIAALAIYVPCEAASKHPYSVEDQLRTETIDRAMLSPDGSRIIFESSGPWETLPDVGAAGSESSTSLGTATLLESSVLNPATVRPLFEPAPGAGYWVDGFSPSGRRVALSWLKDRVHKSGVFDFSTRKLTEFPFVPYFAWHQTRPVWISDEELIYAVNTRDAISGQQFYRLAIADRLKTMWERSWAGREAAVTVLRSGTEDRARPPLRKDGVLLRVNAQTGASVSLSEGIFTNLTLSADRRWLAAFRMGGLVQPKGTALDSPSLDNRRSQVAVFDLSNDNLMRSVSESFNACSGTLQWSDDSRNLLVFTRVEDEPWENGRFLRYEVASGQTSRIEHTGLDLVSELERDIVLRPEAVAWIGGRLAVFARPRLDGDTTPRFSDPGLDWSKARPRADWFLVDAQGKTVNVTAQFKSVSSRLLGASKEAIFVFADGHVWRLANAGKPANVTAGYGGPFEQITPVNSTSVWGYGLSYAERKPSMYPQAVLRESGKDSVLALDLSTGAAVHIPAPDKDAVVVTASVTGRAALYYSSSRAGGALDLGVKERPITRLKTINAHLAEVEPARRVAISHLFNGEKLTDCAWLPADWVPGRKYPVIVEIYPSRTPDCSAPTHLTSRDLIPTWGYIYFEPQTPRHLIRTAAGPVQGITAVTLAAVDELIAQGYADADRLGLLGESQGGFAAPWILTQTQRFKTAVAINGGSDHASLYSDLPMAMSVLAEEWFDGAGAPRYENASSDFYLGFAPWENPEVYVRNSAYFQAGKIQTPLLMLQADLDFFPVEQYELLFGALYRQGKSAELVRYWGEGHDLRSPANFRDSWERIRGWYDSQLMVETNDPGKAR